MKSLELLFIFLRLGLTSFGGPIAHLGYFRDEFVTKRKWLSEHAYADLVSLCQFLPGPASSQVGMGIGLSRLGIWGAILAWIGFTLPSAIVLVLCALGMAHFDTTESHQWLHALKVVAVAVVAQAVLGMGKKLCPDRERISIAVIASVIVLFVHTALIQVLVLTLAGIYGAFFLKSASELPHEPLQSGQKRFGAFFLLLFAGILFILPILRPMYPLQALQMFDSFFRSGALVFGGGHVVLPLIQAEVVPTGWVTNDLFMAGYGLANAIPGPLFTFSAYLGAVSSSAPNGWFGALIALVAIFLPSFLLIIGALPFWEKLRTLGRVRQSISGVNAAVVGILLAALYDPVWTSAIFSAKDFALAMVGFLLLEFWKIPSWAAVALTVGASFIIY
ncbi:MAG TPA: chromate efflux transporter [Bacteriovoracaceae bacterium]|nr:chromate efflux transporter [Bacteriovoracaceae bacterium]